MNSRNRRALLTATGLFAVSLALYVGTLAPSVVTLFDDSLEFQLVTFQLGIAHPTGYPLYTLLGKLFTFLPVGNVAYRVNLMSAVFGAATVALLYLIILRVAVPKKKTNRPDWPTHWGGVIGALLLAVGPVFWQQATIAEVYSLNALFVAALLLLAGHLSPQKPHGIYWTAGLAGLSLTHHRTTLLLLPALIFYLWLLYRGRLFRPKTVLLAVVWGLLPLLLYLYLPLRGHIGSLDGTYQNTWPGFWQQVSGGGYGTFIFDNPFGHRRDFFFYWELLAGQFYTTVPGLIGIIYLLRIGRPQFLTLTGLAFLTYLPFNLLYNVTDIEVFFIPVFLLWAIWSGTGAAFLLRTAAMVGADRRTGQQQTDAAGAEPAEESSTPADASAQPTLWRPVLVGLTGLIFGFMILQLFWTHLPAIQQQYSWQVHDYGLDMLQQPLPQGRSAIVGIVGEMTLLRYFQQTENRRPDVETVAADLESERLSAVENLLAAGKTVYLTRDLPGAAQRWALNAVGPLIRVDPEPVTTPPEISVPVNRPVTPEITLLGYTLSRPPHTGSGPAPVRLRLLWQVGQPPAANLKVSARLLAPEGTIQAAVDAVPVHFAYPTTAWRPAEIIFDVYDLRLPEDAPSGQYQPLIIWYDPAQNAAEVGRIELPPLLVE